MKYIVQDSTLKPAVLIFRNSCDWKANSDCEEASPKDASGEACAQEGEYYAHPTSCSKFHICANGEKFEFGCPGALYFDIKRKVCDFPANVPCQLVSAQSISMIPV